ncbi:MAG: haloacid dehalogenase type II [Candidatus Latescibacterota bacterium]|nr:haloacid dehalogenase type II [Candidatus Latescibacterota bacterium]
MEIRALTFDVFGTVVDWRSTIVREATRLGEEKSIRADWAAFADAWRSGYGPAMNRVRQGELPWTKIDLLHRMILDDLLEAYGLSGLSESERVNLNRVWHRLDPWPDSIGGLTRLKSAFTIATLSNGNVSLLANMAKHVGLPWDVILSAELARHYKPDAESYLYSAELLGEPPERVMMVASHKRDLQAAQSVGFKTAFVARPNERGVDCDLDVSREMWMHYYAVDFHDLADQLGC